MWGPPGLEGQEGSLSRDNRWKGRRNWEQPGLRWPSPHLSSGKQWDWDRHPLSRLRHSCPCAHIPGLFLPTVHSVLPLQGSSILSLVASLVECIVIQKQSFDPDPAWARAWGLSLPLTCCEPGASLCPSLGLKEILLY